MVSEVSQILETGDLRGINKPNKRQRRFIEAYLSPESDTFGNVYQSALVAKFSESTARVLAANSRNTPWIQEVKRLYASLEPEHIYLALQNKAMNSKQDRDQIRALELMAKIRGMFIERSQSDVHVTFNNHIPRPVVEVDNAEIYDKLGAKHAGEASEQDGPKASHSETPQNNPPVTTTEQAEA